MTDSHRETVTPVQTGEKSPDPPAEWESSIDRTPYEDLRALMRCLDPEASTFDIITLAFEYIPGAGPGSEHVVARIRDELAEEHVLARIERWMTNQEVPPTITLDEPRRRIPADTDREVHSAEVRAIVAHRLGERTARTCANSDGVIECRGPDRSGYRCPECGQQRRREQAIIDALLDRYDDGDEIATRPDPVVESESKRTSEPDPQPPTDPNDPMGWAIPSTLRELDVWMLWDGERKIARAPWHSGDLRAVEWKRDLPEEERPETDFATACEYANPPETLPTILLPHEHRQPYVFDEATAIPVMLVDLDDVRNPITEEITDEAAAIVERLDAYTEISSSGTGLHLLVRAELPEWCGGVDVDLHKVGAIEMYDHARLVGCTWRHVPDTPVTVPERQDVIDELYEEYEDEPHRKRRLRAQDAGESEREPDPDASATDNRDRALTELRADGDGTNTDDEGETNPYFQLNIRPIADTGRFSAHRKSKPGDEWAGPHPVHGAQSGSKWDSESDNFAVDTSADAWCCRLHSVGGGSLHLIAVVEEIVNCVNADQLSPEQLLHACVLARDQYTDGTLDDEDPPYKALVGVASMFDLIMADEDDGILGEDGWRIARTIYDDLTVDDLTT